MTDTQGGYYLAENSPAYKAIDKVLRDAADTNEWLEYRGCRVMYNPDFTRELFFIEFIFKPLRFVVQDKVIERPKSMRVSALRHSSVIINSLIGGAMEAPPLELLSKVVQDAQAYLEGGGYDVEGDHD